MSIKAPDALVGAVALEYVLLKLRPQLEEDPEFRGAFHVLSGFSAEQLVGFIQAKYVAGARAARLEIQFPEVELRGHGVDSSCTTTESSVNVRNRNRNGSVTLTAEVEKDAEASLADSDRTDASDLKAKEIAYIWVDFVAKSIGINLLPEDRRKAEAMLKGLFDTGRCPTAKAGEFLFDVLTHFHSGEVLNRAAGKALPIIGLPLFEDCFSALNEEKMAQPSQWAVKFKSHYSLECYLDKRGLAQELLDPDVLRGRLFQLRSPDQQPPIPEAVLAGFHDYIESTGTRNSATETLLFKFDWNHTNHCFVRAKKTSAKDFSERTRNALEAEAITPTPDDELVLHALTKIARKPGSASEEFREFFERRTDALEKDTPLYLEWEDFVHGKKIECVDLFQGIFECVQRAIRGLSSLEGAYVVLEGRQQKKPNSFMEMNQRACEFFERAYGALAVRTKKKIQFTETLVCNYSRDVLPRIKDKPKFKGSSKSGRATTLSFLVSVFQKQRRGMDRKVVTLSLSWKFPIGSVLGQEVADFDAMCRYQAQRGTALIECVAEYEVVGRKGLPVSLSLENVEGFADVARGGGRGAFIPAQDRIKSLAAQWKEILDGAASRHWLLPEQISGLLSDFNAFDAFYCEAVLALRKSALACEKVADVAAAYRGLLLSINGLKHQDARRQLLRIVLGVGLAQVQRSGRRPPMAVICPWHPLRMEAAAGRQQQVLDLIEQLLKKDRPPFSDGTTGSLFFREVEQLLAHPLYPEMTVVWENTQAFPRVVTQAFAGYTLHQPPEPSSESAMPSLDDESSTAAATIEHEMIEYLRLQPHERDNFSVLLYNCDSPDLPTAVVEGIHRINAKREDDKITCQVLLMHRDEGHLRQIYRDLVARGVDTEADPTESSGDFLAKVRVNITAANRLRREGRSQPVDIAYCRDLISREAKPVWDWLSRETATPQELQPHQWSRRLPVSEGDRKVRLQLVCPAQTETGWAYLYSLAVLCAPGADDAWAVGKCPVLMRCLDFDDQSVERIFRETHELATWVVNQDELLDRKLLEAQQVKVIRYVQSATHGRNLIISSDARETLLVNTLKEKLKALLASDTPLGVIDTLCKRFMEDANGISGGLVLKAARRANNTNELLGMVLSRYLVQSELGAGRPIAWCFLDDYSQWLGKKEGANIADLLVLAPKTNEDGSMHLDVVVTEAKFVTYDALSGATSTSAKQLVDTLSQLTEAMDGEACTIDQDIWLARLSDLLVSQTVVAPGQPPLDTVAWRRAIRQRQCTVRIWGFSHVFVSEPHDLTAQISTVKGIPAGKGRAGLDSLQETFGPGHVRELIVHYHDANHKATAELRLRNGHPAFGKSKLYHLASKTEGKTASKKSDQESLPDDTLCGTGTEPDLQTPTPMTPQGAVPGSQALGLVSTTASDCSTTQTISPGASAGPLIAFLESRAAIVQTSEADGQVWLESTTVQLRQALVTRGLPAKLVEGLAPILTPNAGIIKLQGSKDLTVQAVESRADEIFTSEGIKIIHTTPESGRVSIAVERPNRQVLHTEPVLLGYLRSYSQKTHGEKLCVGIREEDGHPLLLDPLNQPHTLIAGITGSGKSVLMQNLILSIAATRSPEEAHIYLIDPKYGVDYRPLDELPHVEVGSGGIVDDPAAAVRILGGLVDEMNGRYELFKQAKVANIHAYRRATGKPLPTLWIIHDEFADWMQTDGYKDSVPNIVGRLSVKARAAGIFLLFAAQRPDKDVMPMQLRSQLGNRLILKVDNAGTAEIAMGNKNSGAERLLGRGHMLAKTGDTPAPVFAQVPFIDMEQTIPQIVRLIRMQYGRSVEPQP
jgi:DNA segregation ATPase FtsK/SpoIIIE, S-DNA-T family